jgi:single-stranded DNA-binding protein
MNQQTVTLTGYLGNDPAIGETEPRTWTRYTTNCCKLRLGDNVQPDDFALLDGEEDVTAPAREYAVLNLATHQQIAGRRRTTWHRIVVWNADRTEHRAVRLSRKGDQVRVTGRPSWFKSRDGRKVKQIQLDRLEILRSKPRFIVP